MSETFLARVKRWSEETAHVEVLLVVGSHARGTQRPDSDLDLVLVTTEKTELVLDPSFPETFGKVLRRQTEHYGACTSVRVRYEGGLEVEFGLVEPTWLALPLDVGTRRVLADGHRVLVDKKRFFEALTL